MECLSQVFSIVPCLWECSDKHSAYIRGLEDNLNALRTAMDKLNNLCQDVKNRVKEAEEQRMKRTHQVNGWLARVEAMEKEVNQILQKGTQELENKCLGSRCPKNCRSSYKLGKKVTKMLPQVTELAEEGKFVVVADQLLAPTVEDLKENLGALRAAMDELNNLYQDVKNRVKEAEEQQMKRTNQVNGWLHKVEAMENEVNQILQNGTQELGNNCLGSPKNCRSSYKLGKKVTKMLPQVTGLAEKGKFDVVADQLPPPPVDEQPMENAVVGFESKFQEVWQVVEEKDCPVIGLVGIGGVGKTTLLKQLNNEFLKATHGYDLVIWVLVSKPASLGGIQDAIRKKLNIGDDLWANKSEGERAILIHNILKEKKFVILLDDIWEPLELSDVGIPRTSRDSMSKVVLTTRSRDVCQSMDADKSIKVGCLPPNEAFTLFCSKVGEDMLKSHPEIYELVKDVASECQGLPLALVTIGRAMKGKTDAQQWKDAKMTLEKYPSTFKGMEGRVFARLLFSYDSLPTPTLRKCFEYCSLYPEDHNIPKEEIIRLWLAEGLIDKYDDMSHAFLQGRRIIEDLMQASLLETGQWERTVKMHDVIRDMALWVACDRGEKKNKFWVNVASGDHDAISAAPNVMKNWSTDAEKISVWGGCTTNVGSLVELSSCSNLVTMIIRDTMLEELPGEVFRSLNVLKVLDLSYNKRLMRLPIEIGGLVGLEYLNIRDTKVRRLPVEVKQLKQMRFLIIDENTIIPKYVISNLWLLQTFEQSSSRMWDTIEVELEVERRPMEREMLQELEELKHMMDLRLALTSATGIQILLNSPKLQSYTSVLTLTNDEYLPDVFDLGEETLTKHLETLRVYGCQMSGINVGRSSLWNNLSMFALGDCNKIRNLSWLIYVPNLCTLYVDLCESMEELIGEETRTNVVGTSLFSRLTTLTLIHLPKLRSICPQSALPFPSLKLMRVIICISLRKLPLDLNTVTTAPPDLKIKGERGWWNRLQWDDQDTKDAFTPKFSEW